MFYGPAVACCYFMVRLLHGDVTLSFVYEFLHVLGFKGSFLPGHAGTVLLLLLIIVLLSIVLQCFLLPHPVGNAQLLLLSISVSLSIIPQWQSSSSPCRLCTAAL